MLWKAPQPRRDAARELIDGFDSAAYPGNGPYFSVVREIAVEFQDSYQAGLQEIHVPRLLFESLGQKGIIQTDPFYTKGESWHVPPDGLDEFNNAIKQGTQNLYHPQWLVAVWRGRR